MVPVNIYEDLLFQEGDGNDFDTSGISHFLSIFGDIEKPKNRKLVPLCYSNRDSCGGIGDRVRGIPFAPMADRQLILDPSLLVNGPEPVSPTTNEHYVFKDYFQGPKRCRDLHMRSVMILKSSREKQKIETK